MISNYLSQCIVCCRYGTLCTANTKHDYELSQNNTILTIMFSVCALHTSGSAWHIPLTHVTFFKKLWTLKRKWLDYSRKLSLFLQLCMQLPAASTVRTWPIGLLIWLIFFVCWKRCNDTEISWLLQLNEMFYTSSDWRLGWKWNARQVPENSSTSLLSLCTLWNNSRGENEFSKVLVCTNLKARWNNMRILLIQMVLHVWQLEEHCHRWRHVRSKVFP